MSEQLLDGAGVLVTRPRHQADELVAAIEALGGVAIPFPVIEIVPRNAAEVHTEVAALQEPAITIFISRNAVDHGPRPALRGRSACRDRADDSRCNTCRWRASRYMPGRRLRQRAPSRRAGLRWHRGQDHSNHSRRRWPGTAGELAQRARCTGGLRVNVCADNTGTFGCRPGVAGTALASRRDFRDHCHERSFASKPQHTATRLVSRADDSDTAGDARHSCVKRSTEPVSRLSRSSRRKPAPR